MAGQPATNGSLALRDFVPEVDAVPVARLRAAGAVIVGKTNNPEFCYRGYTDNAVFGPTRNPWSLTGRRAAPAAGRAPRWPTGRHRSRWAPTAAARSASRRRSAAYSGTSRRSAWYPKLPGFRGWPTLSVDGPLAAPSRDAALALRVMAGAHPADPHTWPVPLRAGPSRSTGRAAGRGVRGSRLGAGRAGGPRRLPGRRRSAGRRRARSPRLPRTPPYPTQLWNDIALPEGFASEGPLLDHGRPMTATREIVESGRSATASDYLDAQERRRMFTGPGRRSSSSTTCCSRRRCRCRRSPPTSPGPPRSTARRSTRSSTTGACWPSRPT